jgi:hypothetical protein
MKPSERINRIFADLKHKNRKLGLVEEKELFIQAILNYLDEQYEAEETARKELREKLVDMD